MEIVFIVQHLNGIAPEQEDIKFIGVYRSADAAHAAIERLKGQPGFRDHPKIIDPEVDDETEGFYLAEHQLDKDNWVEEYGFD
ncbi:DUF7336 domain-containing protein [Dyella caseinilytica]|uniref:Serine kinase n=1 Tax=Dyella caseinilytica TaxID=1849581 RepID=A0ABX7GNX6_9GAMM|nr:serine kinase [Dyella caseinilytica]QRN52129.1 serine kinase [Dyella caseinilytica]